MCNHNIQQVASGILIGITMATLTNNLSWYEHITKITNKANDTELSYIQRNLRQCQRSVKSACYNTYVRPILEYASSVWSPYLLFDILNRIEMV